jgi:hypothetical protein
VSVCLSVCLSLSLSLSVWFSLYLSLSVTRTERCVPHSRSPIRLQTLLRTFSDFVEQKTHCYSRFSWRLTSSLRLHALLPAMNVLTAVRCDLAPSYLNSLKNGISRYFRKESKCIPHYTTRCLRHTRWLHCVFSLRYEPNAVYYSDVGIFPEGEDSRGDQGLGRLVEFRFKGPPGTPSSYIATHIIGTT